MKDLSPVYWTAALIVLVATAAVFFGSALTVFSDAVDEEEHHKQQQQSSMSTESNPPIVHEEVTWLQVVAFPIIASMSLLSLFFFFSYLQYLLFVLLTVSSVTALYSITSFTLGHLPIAASYSPNVNKILSIVFTTCVFVHWLLTGHWLSHDTLCVTLCLLCIHTLRLPSFKLITVFFTILLLYDVFWVFCSEYFFKDNVMVRVAVQQATHPLRETLNLLHSNPAWLDYLPKHIELPLKMIFPVVVGDNNGGNTNHADSNHHTIRVLMLGLGDIALPGALVAYLLRCDLRLLQLQLQSPVANNVIDEKNMYNNSINSINSNTIDHINIDVGEETVGDVEMSSVQNPTSPKRHQPHEPVVCSLSVLKIAFCGMQNFTSTTTSNNGKHHRSSNHTNNSSKNHMNNNVFSRLPLFSSSILAYGVGLSAAFVANFYSGHAQPALVYLVPCLLLTTLFMANHFQILEKVWEGVDNYQRQQIALHHRL